MLWEVAFWSRTALGYLASGSAGVGHIVCRSGLGAGRFYGSGDHQEVACLLLMLHLVIVGSM